ncbi:hypothetical protein [Azospirillum sp. ST 5-10]|uniref:hypothetical protein n=1 Tax=unclassified Azospirillum TaxID=2630922 RepID=UPI003F4A7153
MGDGTGGMHRVGPDEERSDPWLSEVVLEFATLAGVFALLFGLFFLVQALKDLPA